MTKPWHEGRPKTTQIVVFPPLGQEAAFEASKERLGAHLRRSFPGMDFELSNTGLYDEASVLPLCGTVGGEDSRILAPPSEATLRAIEVELNAFDLARTGLS
jgi:hypothetical protein